MKRLLYITQYYATNDQPGVSRHYQHIQHLLRNGYKVVLITSYVKHRLRVIPPEYRGKLIAKEEHDNLTIYRIYAYPNYGRDFKSRMLNYLSFMFLAILTGLRTGSFDIVLASSPSLFVGLAGYILSRIKRAPFVLEVRDLWPETAVIMGALRNPFLIRLSTKLAFFLYRKSAQIIPVTEGIREGVLQSGIPESKITLITNGVDDESFVNLSSSEATEIRKKYGWNDHFVALYAGTLARSDGLEAIVRGASLLSAYDDILVVFLGDGEVKPDLMSLTEELRLSNVVFIPSQPKRTVPAFVAAADACIMPVKDNEFFHMHLPNKLFDYMAGGCPVIAAVPPGEAQTMVMKAGSGVVIPPEDEIELATALLDLRDNPKECVRYALNGRRFVYRYYRRSQLAGRLVTTLDSILKDKGVLASHEAEHQRL